MGEYKLEPEVKDIIKDNFSLPYQFKFIGEGSHNKIILINGNCVLRLGKTEHSKRKMLMYEDLIHKINIRLPVEIPIFDKLDIIDNSDLYTSFAIYQYINGIPMEEYENFSFESIKLCGIFMSKLHTSNIDKTFSVIDLLTEEYEDIVQRLSSILDKKEIEFVKDLYQKFLNSNLIDEIIPTLIHGDLTRHNMLQENDMLNAVIDWDGIHYHDPVYDFANYPFWLFEKIAKYYPNKKLLGNNYYRRYLFYQMSHVISNLRWCTYPGIEYKLKKHIKKFKKAYNNYYDLRILVEKQQCS